MQELRKKITAHEWLVVVPARLGSTRLPSKPLADLQGKPLIVRVVENLRPLAELGVVIIVATDDASVAAVCRAEKIGVQITSADHQSGTDRCYEVAQKNPTSFVLNVQGDEPFVVVEDLLKLMLSVEEDRNADLATLVIPANNSEEFNNKNVVKVVADDFGRALYFSRAGIPVFRDGSATNFLRHIGVYAFRKVALAKFCALPQSKLEKSEKLEQLRALENRMVVRVVEASRLTVGVDTFEDLEVARAVYRNKEI